MKSLAENTPASSNPSGFVSGRCVGIRMIASPDMGASESKRAQPMLRASFLMVAVGDFNNWDLHAKESRDGWRPCVWWDDVSPVGGLSRG